MLVQPFTLRLPFFMPTKFYRECYCGESYRKKLDMYECSVPHGLQRTGEDSEFDLELRSCVRCGTTFAVKVDRKMVRKFDNIKINISA